MIECEPTARLLMAKVAWPELKLRLPKVVAPSLKLTAPVGVPAPGETALTVTVKVTDCPKTDGFAEELTVLLVLEGLTVWLKAEAVLSLALKFVSPL